MSDFQLIEPDAMKAGIEAGKAGKRKKDCPYEKDSKSEAAWLAGFKVGAKRRISQ